MPGNVSAVNKRNAESEPSSSEEVMASSSEAEDRAATSGEGRRTGGVLVEVNVTYS